MAANKDPMGGSKDSTVIGSSILINGKLTGDEDLTVRGRVEGELSLTKTLIIDTSGIVKADVTVRNAIVSGVVVGNVEATESVELTREGRMVGDIRSPRVIIVDGASFRGRVDMGNAEPATKSEKGKKGKGEVAHLRAAARSGGQPPKPPPPPKRQEAKAKDGAKPMPPPSPGKSATPPSPPMVGAGAKKKVVVKKKK